MSFDKFSRPQMGNEFQQGGQYVDNQVLITDSISDPDQLLNVYIYDYLIKNNLQGVANLFLREANLPLSRNGQLVNSKSLNGTVPKLVLSTDSQSGFLLEWWAIFWKVYNTSNTGDKYSNFYNREKDQRNKYFNSEIQLQHSVSNTFSPSQRPQQVQQQPQQQHPQQVQQGQQQPQPQLQQFPNMQRQSQYGQVRTSSAAKAVGGPATQNSNSANSDNKLNNNSDSGDNNGNKDKPGNMNDMSILRDYQIQLIKLERQNRNSLKDIRNGNGRTAENESSADSDNKDNDQTNDDRKQLKIGIKGEDMSGIDNNTNNIAMPPPGNGKKSRTSQQSSPAIPSQVINNGSVNAQPKKQRKNGGGRKKKTSEPSSPADPLTPTLPHNQPKRKNSNSVGGNMQLNKKMRNGNYAFTGENGTGPDMNNNNTSGPMQNSGNSGNNNNKNNTNMSVGNQMGNGMNANQQVPNVQLPGNDEHEALLDFDINFYLDTPDWSVNGNDMP